MSESKQKSGVWVEQIKNDEQWLETMNKNDEQKLRRLHLYQLMEEPIFSPLNSNVISSLIDVPKGQK